MTEEHRSDRRASVWNIVALIATLGLAAVVAIVAVTRSDRTPVAEPTPTLGEPSPSPSPSTLGSLGGEGPFVVYADRTGAVFAWDLATQKATPLGSIDAQPADTPGYLQPGPGSTVAFATDAGTVWRIDREGLKEVARLPVSDGRALSGGVVSRDGRRFATASVGERPELLIVDLQTRRSEALGRGRGSNRYPREPLVPVAWSLGGSLLYQVPQCDCDTPSPGLYVYDLGTERSTLVTATSRTEFYDRFAISPDGQSLVYGTGGSVRCPDNPDERCPAPPFVLRRISAGRPTSTVLRRDNDQRFARIVWSVPGDELLLVLADSASREVTIELAESETGDRIRSGVSGIPADASPIALLPERVLIALVGPEDARSLQVVSDGRAHVLAAAGEGAVFLGWLR